jgi:hypothetical protein
MCVHHGVPVDTVYNIGPSDRKTHDVRGVRCLFQPIVGCGGESIMS